MTNQSTLSVAELVAGALLDHGIAPVDLHGNMTGLWRNKQRGWVLRIVRPNAPVLEIVSARAVAEMSAPWHLHAGDSINNDLPVIITHLVQGHDFLESYIEHMARKGVDPTTVHREVHECQWFALCHNPATGTLEHPILGDVPICDRCRAKDEKLREVHRREMER